MDDSALEQERSKRIDSALSSLSECFDSVQLLASSLQPDGTTKRFFVGTGNFYTRTGMANQFLQEDQARDLAWEIRRSDDED